MLKKICISMDIEVLTLRTVMFSFCLFIYYWSSN